MTDHDDGPSAEGIAKWMQNVVYEEGETLHQVTAVQIIRKYFGEEFLAPDNRGIRRYVHSSVLDAFRAMTEDTVVWSRSGKYWRERRESDPPGRSQP